MKAKLPDLRHLSAPDTRFDVRVTPKAASDRLAIEPDGRIRIGVTAPPEDGRANRAVIRLLSRAIGLPATRLQLIRGETARDKSFRVLP